MPKYRLVERSGVVSRFLRGLKMCFLNVLRLQVSQSQRQKRLYKQYVEQLAGAYIERSSDQTTMHCWDHRYNYSAPIPEWNYTLAYNDRWCDSERSRSYCGSDCSDSGRCSSPCCSEVIFNGGRHFSGKNHPLQHICRRNPVCYPGNFAWVYNEIILFELLMISAFVSTRNSLFRFIWWKFVIITN